jgi:hypothetical protein
MLFLLLVSAVIVVVFLMIYTRGGAPPPRSLRARTVAAALVVSALLGLWGGARHWAGETDKLPFLFMGLFLPVYAVIQGIMVRRPWECALAAGAAGALFLLISLPLYYEEISLITAVALAAEGLLFGGVAAAIARARLRPSAGDAITPEP